MKYYIDCEFDGHNGPLLSMAIITDGGSVHIETDVPAIDLWVLANVMPLMNKHDATDCVKVSRNAVGTVIREFIGSDMEPVIVADSPQDSRYFSQALTTAEDGGYASFPFQRLTIEIHGIDCYPTDLPGAVQHNAWWDAMALREKLSR